MRMGSGVRVTPKRARTPETISRASASRSAVVALARVDQGEGVLGRDARRARGAVALGEARVLDEPRGGNLHQALARVVAGYLAGAAGGRGRLDLSEFPGGEHRVGEEGARAAGVGVAGVEHHALAGADLEHGGADLADARLLPHPDAELGR